MLSEVRGGKLDLSTILVATRVKYTVQLKTNLFKGKS